MSLIEVLVSILVVSLGILVMIVMQVNASKIAKTSEFRAMGSLLASDIADRMRANPQGVLDATGNKYQFEDGYPADGLVPIPEAPSTCEATDCSAADLAVHDLQAWQRTVAASLPGGWVRISALDAADRAVDMWLIWSDPDGANNNLGANECPKDVVADPGEGKVATAAPHCMYFRINL
jgi:type IV pilus assembly protein PilV